LRNKIKRQSQWKQRCPTWSPFATCGTGDSQLFTNGNLLINILHFYFFHFLDKSGVWDNMVRHHWTIECVTDLDEQGEMIIFEWMRPLLNWVSFFEAAEAVVKICSSLKQSRYNHIYLTQIRETLCSISLHVNMFIFLNKVFFNFLKANGKKLDYFNLVLSPYVLTVC